MSEFCNHYQAMAFHKVCKLGIEYTSLGIEKHEDYPCWNEKAKGCSLAEYPTLEEIKERNEHIAQILNRMGAFMKHETDICFHCGKQVKSLQQVGRCVYGSCGCRMWQGKIPKEWKAL